MGVSHGPWREITFGSPYTWVKHSSRKSVATHSYQCVQYFRVSKQFNVRTDVDAWYCARGLHRHRKTKSTLDVDSGSQNSFAALGTRTRFRIAHGFSVGHPTK